MAAISIGREMDCSQLQAVFDKCIPRTKIISCDREWLVSLFLSDGLHVRPNEVSFLETRAMAKEEDDDSCEFGDADTNFITEPSFPVIESAIDSAIKELGGTVFPKLYRAPLDAAWISYSHDLRCRNADEVLTLLKCSERVTNYIAELDDARQLNSINLELREWLNVHPGGEWRCFVKDGYLLAATPRDISCNVLFTEQDSLRVKQKLSNFFDSRKVGLQGCLVIDVYIDELQKIWVFDVESFTSKEKQSEENLWGLFSAEQVQDLFSLQDFSQLPVIRILDETLLFHNPKKWRSGIPWELRSFHAAQTVEKAVSVTQESSAE